MTPAKKTDMSMAMKLVLGWLVAVVSFIAVNFVFSPLGGLGDSVVSLDKAVIRLTGVVEAQGQRQVELRESVDGLAGEMQGLRESLIRNGIDPDSHSSQSTKGGG